MYFSDRFKEIAKDMSVFLEGTTVEVLVRHGFRVGTAGKVITYREDELENTTINTLRDLAKAIEDVEGSELNEDFNSFLEEAFIIIESAPRAKLLNKTGFSPSTIAGIKSKGSDGNYQTSKFLALADAANSDG